MVTIVSRGNTRKVPGCIEELTPEQYRYYLILSTALVTDAVSPEYFKRRWISYLLGMGEADYTILKTEHIAEIEEQADSIMTGYMREVEGNPLPVMHSPINLLPQWNGHTGPSDWLHGLSMGKFVECSTLLDMMAKGVDVEENSEQIARVLYDYASDETPDVLTVQHSVLLFTAVWNAIQSAPVEINGQPVDFSIIFKADTQTSRADDKTGWTGILFEIAQAGLFGTMAEVEQTDFWSVLLYLYKCKFEYNQDKKQK